MVLPTVLHHLCKLYPMPLGHVLWHAEAHIRLSLRERERERKREEDEVLVEGVGDVGERKCVR